MLWFALASVVAGAVIGAFFGGVGALPGALASAKFMLAAGEGILILLTAAEAAAATIGPSCKSRRSRSYALPSKIR